MKAEVYVGSEHVTRLEEGNRRVARVQQPIAYQGCLSICSLRFSF